MNVHGLIAIGAGAVLGAWLRWWLGAALNPVFPGLPLGTLAANIIGGYLVGVAIALFAVHTSWPPEVRLLVITGLLGAFTTFSTFSAEVVALILRTRYVLALAAVCLHVFGSLAMTALGLFTVNVLTRT